MLCHTAIKHPKSPNVYNRQHNQHVKVQSYLRGNRAQCKLTVGASNDRFEQEADRVSVAVLGITDSDIKNSTKLRDQTGNQRPQKPPIAGQGESADPLLDTHFEQLQQSGQTLPAVERDFFEPRFGYDFGSIRLHTGDQAATLATAAGARAFTLGPDIVFGEGEYAPGTGTGRALLAHELTHTIQQQAAQRTGNREMVTNSQQQHAVGISQMSGPGRLQRLALTNGQFGLAMQKYQRDIGVPDRPLRLIRRSSLFMNMLRTLDRHYVSLHEPSLPSYFETGADGKLTNDRDSNGRWAGSNRRVIHLWSSGVDESNAFEPASRSTYPYDVMWLHDIFYYTQLPPTDQLTQDGTFIEALAHETTHAHNLVTGTGHGSAGPNPTLAASIAASVQEEIQTRQQEARVMSQVQRGGRLRGFRPSTGSTSSRDVQRSLVSGTPRRTYLEMFFFANKLLSTGRSLSDDQASSLERTVERIPLSAASASQFLDKSKPIFFYDNSLGLYDLITADYGKWLFWQRVIDKRWEAFQNSATQSPAAQERILQEHARAYFDSGVAYLP